MLLDFRDRTRTGIFSMVWPLARSWPGSLPSNFHEECDQGSCACLTGMLARAQVRVAQATSVSGSLHPCIFHESKMASQGRPALSPRDPPWSRLQSRLCQVSRREWWWVRVSCSFPWQFCQWVSIAMNKCVAFVELRSILGLFPGYVGKMVISWLQ